MASSRILLRSRVEALRAKAAKLRAARAVNEEATKAALIVPLLDALGWDTSNTDEVQYEYRRRGSENPVDFALMIRNEPVLFVEAKALASDLTTGKATNQLVSYATQSGVSWAVLTNGIEYHVYNAHAAVPLEEKILRKLSIADGPVDDFVNWIALLSKSELTGKRIDRVWESTTVETQVKRILERELAADRPGKRLVDLIVESSKDTLDARDVAAALRRARVSIEFPPVPVDRAPASERAPKLKIVKLIDSKPADAPRATLEDLIRAGRIQPPAEIVANYRGRRLVATILHDARIRFEGKVYPSLSAAGAAARKPFFEGERSPEGGPATNGWTFWWIRNGDAPEDVTLDEFARLSHKQDSARA